MGDPYSSPIHWSWCYSSCGKMRISSCARSWWWPWWLHGTSFSLGIVVIDSIPMSSGWQWAHPHAAGAMDATTHHRQTIESMDWDRAIERSNLEHLQKHVASIVRGIGIVLSWSYSPGLLDLGGRKEDSRTGGCIRSLQRPTCLQAFRMVAYESSQVRCIR